MCGFKGTVPAIREAFLAGINYREECGDAAAKLERDRSTDVEFHAFKCSYELSEIENERLRAVLAKVREAHKRYGDSGLVGGPGDCYLYDWLLAILNDSGKAAGESDA